MVAVHERERIRRSALSSALGMRIFGRFSPYIAHQPGWDRAKLDDVDVRFAGEPQSSVAPHHAGRMTRVGADGE